MAEHISREEFHAGLEAIRETVQAGFAGINARLDRLNGKTEQHGKDIVRIDTTMDERDKAATRDNTARGFGAVGAILGGAAVVWKWLNP